MSTRALIEHILEHKRFAVAGASRDTDKYGYQVYRALKEAGYLVFPVNPNTAAVDGDVCYPSLDNVPGPLDCVVTVTQPEVTEEIVQSAGRLRIPYIWMQPGSENNAAFNLARGYSMQIVSGGPCILVALSLRRARLAEAGSV